MAAAMPEKDNNQGFPLIADICKQFTGNGINKRSLKAIKKKVIYIVHLHHMTILISNFKQL